MFVRETEHQRTGTSLLRAGCFPRRRRFSAEDSLGSEESVAWPTEISRFFLVTLKGGGNWRSAGGAPAHVLPGVRDRGRSARLRRQLRLAPTPIEVAKFFRQDGGFSLGFRYD